MNKEQIKSIIVGVLAVGLVGMAYYTFIGSPANLSGQDAAQKAIGYVNAKVLTGADKASVDGKVVSESGLYKFNVKVGSDSFPTYVSKDGKLLFPQVMEIEPVDNSSSSDQTGDQNPAANNGSTLGNFLVSSDEPCYEEGKPVVYFFGSQTCPHCQWEHPIVQKIAKQFEGIISFHDNFDNDKDRDIFSKYSNEGYIPAVVIGCRYYRVGSGENEGEEKEGQNLTALLCKITNNQPGEICSGVKDLVDSING